MGRGRSSARAVNECIMSKRMEGNTCGRARGRVAAIVVCVVCTMPKVPLCDPLPSVQSKAPFF